jgi:hypothetical protein
VPSFRDWEFPHGRIPRWWPPPRSQTSASTSTSASDLRCSLSGALFATTKAYIISRNESEWFDQNSMMLYGHSSRDTGDICNHVTFRADVHLCFDSRIFAIVPKPATASSSAYTSPTPDAEQPQQQQQWQYVAHVLMNRGPADAQFACCFQNTLFNSIAHTSKEYLFARFAWAIFMAVKPFVTAGFNRRVAQLKVSDGADDGQPSLTKVEMLAGSELKEKYGSGGPRGASPTKRRQASTHDALDQDDANVSLRHSNTESGCLVGWYAQYCEVEDRGRPMKRVRARTIDVQESVVVGDANAGGEDGVNNSQEHGAPPPLPSPTNSELFRSSPGSGNNQGIHSAVTI